MKRTIWTSVLSTLFIFSVVKLSAQEPAHQPLNFTPIKILKTTPVKNQARTGTCWDFATTSFVETELLRMGKGTYDLSEMFTVRFAYEDKADWYIREHGMANFGPGGQAHDVMDQIRKHGMIPEKYYKGIQYGEKKHNHSELQTVLGNFLDGVLKARQMTPVWKRAFASIIETYLGKVPDTFDVGGKKMTPRKFADYLDFKPDDYVELTSYTHHPFYKQFVLEVPDNWANKKYYNVPIDEFIAVINHAIQNGYSVAWDGDVSDKGLSSKRGLGIVPVKDWIDMNTEEQDSVFNHPVAGRKITQSDRQKSFDNFKTTDDHLMHLTGIVKDENGKMYYLTKNSHGKERYDYGGFLYLSEPYVRLNTIAIMVHKDALPANLVKKLGIK